jgi:hypothetical protein
MKHLTIHRQKCDEGNDWALFTLFANLNWLDDKFKEQAIDAVRKWNLTDNARRDFNKRRWLYDLYKGQSPKLSNDIKVLINYIRFNISSDYNLHISPIINRIDDEGADIFDSSDSEDSDVPSPVYRVVPVHVGTCRAEPCPVAASPILTAHVPRPVPIQVRQDMGSSRYQYRTSLETGKSLAIDPGSSLSRDRPIGRFETNTISKSVNIDHVF